VRLSPHTAQAICN